MPLDLEEIAKCPGELEALGRQLKLPPLLGLLPFQGQRLVKLGESFPLLVIPLPCDGQA